MKKSDVDKNELNETHKEKDWKELREWKKEQEKIKLENEMNNIPKNRGLEKLEDFLSHLQTGLIILGFIVFFLAILFVIMRYRELDL